MNLNRRGKIIVLVSVLVATASVGGFFFKEKLFTIVADVTGQIDESSDSYPKRLVEFKLSQANEKIKEQKNVLSKRENIPLWNDGADYAPELKSKIDSLPQSGGTVVIPPGRYNILTGISLSKNNITLKATNLGDVSLEAPNDQMEYVISSTNLNNIIIENLVLRGRGSYKPYGIYITGGDGVRIISNLVENFQYSIFAQATPKGTSRDIRVINNYVLNAGFNPIRIGAHDNKNDIHRCDDKGRFENILVDNNFISTSGQGLIIACSFSGRVNRNIVRESKIAGLRIETAQNLTISNNLLYENYLDGLWLYGLAANNRISHNVITDNNKRNMPFTSDCWSTSAIFDLYQKHFAAINSYPYLDTDKRGQPLFKNYWCQFNGLEVELRNQASNNTIEKNVIGRYSKSSGKNTGWESLYDIRISYFTNYYQSDKTELSVNNKFDSNYFIGGSTSRILNEGCGNIFTNNKTVVLSPYKVKQLKSVSQNQPLCSN